MIPIRWEYTYLDGIRNKYATVPFIEEPCADCCHWLKKEL